MKGRIFSIEEFATFDGPGIRMTVFLKGCPLRCTWCHNPEGQRLCAEFVRTPNGCIACGACERNAKRLSDGTLLLTEASKNACPKKLVKLCGEDYEAKALCERILSNADILSQAGGGVTFSGGEPLMQYGFLLECLSLLRGRVHRAIQTCGYADGDKFKNVLSECDYVLYDLKLMDKEKHIAFCGVDNSVILKNYEALARSEVPFVTRVPLIAGVTDTEENLCAMAKFVSGLGVRYIEVLPYNRMAGSKYGGLLRKYEPRFDEKREVSLGTDIFAAYGIEAKKM